MLVEYFIIRGNKSTRPPLIRSHVIMVALLFHLSTYMPAIGPIINTGIIVKERSFASSMVEPGARRYTRPIKAIWSSLSPKFETIWANHRRKKFLSLRSSLTLAIIIGADEWI